MLSPGHKSLGSFNITIAGTQVGDAVVGLEGLLSMRLKASFAYGSGGTTCKLFVQTSIDNGNTWGDFVNVAFGNSTSESPVLNLTNLTPKTTQLVLTDGGLADDTVIDGIISSKIRCKVVTTGTYSGSTVLTVDADVS